MRKTVGAFLAVAVLLGSVFAWTKQGRSAHGETPNAASALNYLVFGVDEAGANTDVVLLVGYRSEENALTVMQLPRDTYIAVNGHGRKINSIYASRLQEHGDRKRALQETGDIIAAALQIRLDGEVLFGLSAFSRLVDRIGGVPINLPFEMNYRDDSQGLSISLPAGETVLDGKGAEQFVRFRATYLEGDVGRLDAQKLFMFAFLKKAMQETDFFDILDLSINNGKDVVAQGNFKNTIKIAADSLLSKSKMEISFMTMPGDALYDGEDHTWYYVMNRDAGINTIQTYFTDEMLRSAKMDEGASFYKKGNNDFENIYFATDISVTVYTPENMDDIIIKKKE